MINFPNIGVRVADMLKFKLLLCLDDFLFDLLLLLSQLILLYLTTTEIEVSLFNDLAGKLVQNIDGENGNEL